MAATNNIDVSLQPLERLKLVSPDIFLPHLERVIREPYRSGSVLIALLKPSNERVTEKEIPIIYIPAVVPVGLRVGYISSTDQTLEQSLKHWA